MLIVVLVPLGNCAVVLLEADRPIPSFWLRIIGPLLALVLILVLNAATQFSGTSKVSEDWLKLLRDLVCFQVEILDGRFRRVMHVCQRLSIILNGGKPNSQV